MRPASPDAARRPLRRRFWLWFRVACVVVGPPLLLLLAAYSYYRLTVDARLREAVAEVDLVDPGWRWDDLQARRAVLADEENAGLVVQAAAELLPARWWAADEPAQKALDGLRPEEQLDEQQVRLLTAELDRLRPSLDEARRLAAFRPRPGMPAGRYSVAWTRDHISTLLPHMDRVRNMTHLLTWDAALRAQREDAGGTVLSCLSAVNAGRSVGDEPCGVVQLTRVACVLQACKAAERALAQGQPPPTVLRELQGALDEEAEQPVALIVARGERAAVHRVMEAVEAGEVGLWQLAGDREPSFTDRLASLYTPDVVKPGHAEALRVMTEYVAITRLAPHEREARLQAVAASVRGMPKDPARIFLPAVDRLLSAIQRAQTQFRCMAVALAAERYRQERGRWPATLEKLVPDYLGEVPPDPYDNKSLRFRWLDDGVLVYSVGGDGRDDKGTFDAKMPTRAGADLGVRLWNVSHRRQLPKPTPAPENP